ncbi:MAG TPA: thioredoxin, partial [Candidatus Altiarchaeales archaeon]|nr:thioredoxin [Candidatus Altiarchaeales archaeon]
MLRFEEIRVGVKDKIPFFVITLICLSSIIVNGQDEDKVEIYFFYSKTCPHCAQEKPFLQELERRYPRLKVNYLVVSENRELLLELCKSHNTSPAGVPRTFIGDKVFIGYSPQECDLIWYQGYLAYLGCPNQIENEVRQLMNLSATISKGDAMKSSMNDPLVINLTLKNKDAIANVFLRDDVYLVAWWTPERIKSKLNYPNVLVTIDAKTGDILKSEIPDTKISGILKPPLSETNYV